MAVIYIDYLIESSQQPYGEETFHILTVQAETVRLSEESHLPA